MQEIPPISPSIVIMTRDELNELLNKSYQNGVKNGRYQMKETQVKLRENQ